MSGWKAELAGINLWRADLRDANLMGTKLMGTNLSAFVKSVRLKLGCVK